MALIDLDSSHELWHELQEKCKDSKYVKRTDPYFRYAVRNYRQAVQELKKAQEEVDMMKLQLLEACDETPSEGEGVLIQRISRKGNVDYSQIPELLNVDLEQYRKPTTESWRISDE